MGSGPAAKLTLTYILAPLKNVLLSHDSHSQSARSLKPPSCLEGTEHDLCLQYKRARDYREQTQAKTETEMGKMIEADTESERMMSAS